MQDCIRSTRRSAGAADEAGRDGGGRKKGRFVRMVRMVKVEETLTRAVLPGLGRTRRASRLIRNSVGRMPKKEEEEEEEEATAVNAEEEAREESGNGDDDESGRVG